MLRKCLALSALAITSLEAYQPFSDIAFTGGWRKDEVKSDLVFEVPKGNPTAFDNLKARNLDIWQLGVKATLTLPPCWVVDNCCDNWWLNQFYVRGYAYWGWGENHGKYTEIVNAIPPKGPNNITKARPGHLRTRDFDIAIGWLYPFCCDYWSCWDGFAIGPVFGYSYDRIKFKLKDVYDATLKIKEPGVNGTTFASKWKGPWLGVDAYYRWSNVILSAGYEYHWIKWDGAFNVPASAIGYGFISDRRHAHDGNGNVARFDAVWTVCECWEAGLGVKYRYFKANKGKEVPVGGFAANGLPADEFDRAKASWQSWEVTGNIGILF